MPLLRLNSVVKAFGGAAALDHVDFTVEQGRVHALLGGNGSGKSTLIKILAGIYTADAGQIEMNGAVRDLGDAWSPAAAQSAGFRFLHQDVGLFPDFSVAENLCAGVGWDTTGPQIRWRAVHAKARKALDGLGIDVSPHARLGSLSPAQQTMVAIARAVSDLDTSGDRGLLVLDEPSAALPDHEMRTLMDLVRTVARRGHAVLYVSHRLEEVLAIADEITVLRDGRVAGRTAGADNDKNVLMEMIVGRPAQEVFVPAGHVREGAAPLFEVRDLTADRVHDVSFDVHKGEVLGVAGLADAGGAELLQALFGLRPARGRLALDERRLPLGKPAAAVRDGIAYVPADRLGAGVFGAMSVIENVSIGSLPSYFSRGRMAQRQLLADAEAQLDAHRVRRTRSDSFITHLSGGNQQKVVLARSLRRRPRVLLLDDPTQGVDVGAKADIWALIRKLTDQGSCVVVHSTDYEELIDVADRVLVLRDGGVSAVVAASDLDRQRLTELTYRPLPAKAG